jgi:hypothetical protein
MSFEDVVIQHGEKAAVALVAVICAWLIYGALTDPDIRPDTKGADAKSVAIDLEDVRSKRKNFGAPTLTPPPNYSGQMTERLDAPVKTVEFMADLASHPDAGPLGGPKPVYIYIYELLQPEVTAKDEIGQFRITVTPPPATRKANTVSEERLSDNPEQEWVRNSGEDEIKNSAAQVGAFIEIRKGQNPWQALAAEGVKNGFATLERLSKPFFAPSEEWEQFSFRATMVARATGYPFGKEANLNQAVLVSKEPVDLPEDASAWWLDLAKKVGAGDADTVKKFVVGTRDLSISLKQPLAANELLYKGNESPVFEIAQASSPTRFIVTSISTGVGGEEEDGNGPVKVHVLLNKFFSNKAGAGAWLAEPKEYELTKGDMLGAKNELVPDPFVKTKSSKLDLSTPFELVDVEVANRIYYYQIDEVARPNGKGSQRSLAVNPRDKPYTKASVAVFKNKKTGQTFRVLKTDYIPPPTPKMKCMTPVYPFADGKRLDEKAEFKANPAAFVAVNQSKPPEPVPHEPNEGPLADLIAKKIVDVTTDTTYFSMPNGDIVFWDADNKRTTVLDKKGQEQAEAAMPPPDESDSGNAGDAGDEGKESSALDTEKPDLSHDGKPADKATEKTVDKPLEKPAAGGQKTPKYSK